jgi:hypothetical protein
MTPTERADAIDLAKRRVEECLEDYRKELLAYAVWLEGYRARQAAQHKQEYGADA